MKKIRLISVSIASIFAMTLGVPLFAAAGSHSITTQQIAAAVNGAGLKISAEQVVLLTDVVATTSAPALQVESMEQWGERRMKVRIGCVNSGECLPFFVAVDWGSKDAGGPADADRLPANVLRPNAGPKSIVVRAGSPATLLLDGEHIHIKLSVICLENGTSGQTIRVSSMDHRLTYTAQVGEGAILRGRL